MAKNKRDIDQQVKRAEIEAAALQLFLSQGYEATSMAAVATQASVAPNTLYWYFDSKDDLLVAVLNQQLSEAMTQYAQECHKPVGEQLTWMLARFEQVSPLINTVHARLAKSPSIKQWHDQFHLMLDGLLVAQMCQRGVSNTKAKLLATVGTFVMEGLLSHPHSNRQREMVVSWMAGIVDAAA
jgi:TetR/AcrR family transcriptional regulator of autoinduction and epiphytic fitness